MRTPRERLVALEPAGLRHPLVEQRPCVAGRRAPACRSGRAGRGCAPRAARRSRSLRRGRPPAARRGSRAARPRGVRARRPLRARRCRRPARAGDGGPLRLCSMRAAVSPSIHPRSSAATKCSVPRIGHDRTNRPVSWADSTSAAVAAGRAEPDRPERAGEVLRLHREQRCAPRRLAPPRRVGDAERAQPQRREPAAGRCEVGHRPTVRRAADPAR